jgi:hypothetical protein
MVGWFASHPSETFDPGTKASHCHEPNSNNTHNAFATQNELGSDVMMSVSLWDRMMGILGDETFNHLGPASVDLDTSMFPSFSESLAKL